MIFLQALLIGLGLPIQAQAEVASLDTLMSVAAFIYQAEPVVESGKKTSKMQTSFGSGFLVAGEDGDLFFVTASHVATGKSDPKLVIGSNSDEPLEFSLKSISRNGALGWVHHPTADVAVLQLARNLGAEFHSRFLSVSYFRTDRTAPRLAQSLRVIGFPLALGVSGKFSPILKVVRPASRILTLNRFDTKSPSEFFLIDDPSIQGYSGAPLYAFPDYGPDDEIGGVSLRNAAYFAGLIHGTISDETGGKLGAVVPAYFVYETIKMSQGKK